MTTHRTLEQAIGGELRRLREANGVRQDTVASAAQMFGLNWTQSTVAAIEGGRRSLSIGELGMLPMIVTQADIYRPWVSRVLDFFPDTDEWVIVAPGHEAPLKSIRWLYGTQNERERAPGYKPPAKSSVRVTPATGTLALVGEPAQASGIGSDVETEAERKAARVLDVSPEAVLRAAMGRWGHSLANERDRRIGPRAGTLAPRSLQAVRGRVTRELVSELKPVIKRRRRR
jgi:transcriptional regulator with XRE-family HTH domain